MEGGRVGHGGRVGTRADTPEPMEGGLASPLTPPPLKRHGEGEDFFKGAAGQKRARLPFSFPG